MPTTGARGINPLLTGDDDAVTAPAAADEKLTRAKREALELAKRVRDLAPAGKITTPEEQAQVAQLLTEVIKPLEKRVDETFDPIIRAAQATLNTARAQRDEVRAPIKLAESVAKTLLLDYHERQEQARRVLADRMREREAQREAARVEREEAGLAPHPMFLPQPPPPPVAPVAKPSGISTRKRWTYELLDAAQLRREYLKADEVKLRKLVEALGADAPASVSSDPAKPAIKVWQVSGMAAKAAD